MANSNLSLHQARAAKKDEFYTQLSDIENELRHYRKHFKGKTILCNCDDPFESNFFKYFVLNFNRLGLKKLIATCYTGSPIAGTQLSLFDIIGDNNKANTPYKAIVTTVYDVTGDGGIDMFDIAELFKQGENTLEELSGNGDYRSPECLELMDEADIVVTNPPFSLFREFIATLLEHGKKFVVIGNQNAITYKEIFPLFQANKIWLGYGFQGNVAFFESPYDDFASSTQHREGLIRVSGVMWFTNLDLKKRHENIIMVKRYDPDRYPHYENYDGIDVKDVSDIPYDYAGVMGVPITFFEKYNPDQFEIVGFGKGALAASVGVTKNYRGRTDLAYVDKSGEHKGVYCHVLIRNKYPEQPKEN